jgi:ParB family chromosome partitioning protein
MAKPALGRGLGALLGGASPTAKTPLTAVVPTLSTATVSPAPAVDARDRVQRVPLERVRPCPFQPRKEFTAEALRELADSIREQGIIQPLLVRAKADHFELIAGERRWRAAQLLALKEVPVILRQADDREVLELALIENLQRENLNPLEEAQGYSELVEKFHLRQEDVAVKVGKSRALVANALRLLKLPADVQAYVRDGRLSVGHAKVILGLPSAAHQSLAAERVIKGSLNVRQTEELVTLLLNTPAAGHAHKPAANAFPPTRDAQVASLESKLRERLGTKVNLRYRQGKGAIDIRFFSDDELERILQIVGVNVD